MTITDSNTAFAGTFPTVSSAVRVSMPALNAAVIEWGSTLVDVSPTARGSKVAIIQGDGGQGKSAG